MKQALTEALAFYKALGGRVDFVAEFVVIEAAARLVERLLPGVCPCWCHITSYVAAPDHHSPMECRVRNCNGSGQVWDEGIVEVVANPVALEIYNNEITLVNEWQGIKSRRAAVALLLALVELLTEKVEEPPKDPWDYDP